MHFLVIILVTIGAFQFCLCADSSSVRYDESVLKSEEDTASVVSLPPYSDISPTKPFDPDAYLVSHINESLISYPVIHSFFLLDKKVVEILQNFTASPNIAEATTKHKILILRYIEDWKENYCKQCDSNNTYKLAIPEELEDPVSSLRTIRRLRVDLPKIKDFSQNESWKKMVVDKIQDAEVEVGIFPENDHLIGYALSLMRLSHVYDENPQNLVEKSNIKLKVEEIAHVGIEAHEIEYYGRAAEWLSFAKKVSEDQRATKQSFSDSTIEYISTLLQLSMFYHDKFSQALGSENQDGNFYAPLKNVSLEEQSSVASKRNVLSDPNIKDPNYSLALRKLCQGKETKNVTSSLKCRLDSRKSHWFLLMPAKVEEVFEDPEILVFHDILRPPTMKLLRQTAMPLQVEAKIHTVDREDSKTFLPTRMSYVSWFSETLLRATSSLQRKIEALTGMKASDKKKEAETFQINVYGAGGHYGLHRDAFGIYEQENPDEKSAGDRIATFMIYLNSVKSGGRTVFPLIGAKVEPVEGSAVFWKNLLPSGETDSRMFHSGCPVNSGIKWVCNRWIRHNAQVQSHPCPVDNNQMSTKSI